MNQSLMDPLSPELQQKLMGQLYRLLEKQVQSYHNSRHMGAHSSIRTELAHELMESIAYTLDRSGILRTGENLEEALLHGQEQLKETHTEALSTLELVQATAPAWQTECRWEALHCLRTYIVNWDPIHLAHKGPDTLYYPILISPSEGIQGIDSCLFYLKILWIENQIMASVPDDVLGQLWDRLPIDTHNQCEHLLLNGIGKVLIGSRLDPLIFTPEEKLELLVALLKSNEHKLKNAARELCRLLGLKDENAVMYVQAAVPLLTLRLDHRCDPEQLVSLFL